MSNDGARNVANDLLEALKVLEKGQTIAMLLCNEPLFGERVYDLLKRHVEECEEVLKKYPNLHASKYPAFKLPDTQVNIANYPASGQGGGYGTGKPPIALANKLRMWDKPVISTGQVNIANDPTCNPNWPDKSVDHPVLAEKFAKLGVEFTLNHIATTVAVALVNRVESCHALDLEQIRTVIAAELLKLSEKKA